MAKGPLIRGKGFQMFSWHAWAQQHFLKKVNSATHALSWSCRYGFLKVLTLPNLRLFLQNWFWSISEEELIEEHWLVAHWLATFYPLPLLAHFSSLAKFLVCFTQVLLESWPTPYLEQYCECLQLSPGQGECSPLSPGNTPAVLMGLLGSVPPKGFA